MHRPQPSACVALARAGAARVLLLAGIAFCSPCDAVWVADDHGLQRIDDVTGRPLAGFVASGIVALAGTHDDGVWVLRADELLQVDVDGEVRARVDVDALGYGEGELLAADPYDDSAWIVTAGNLLAHFAGSGGRLGAYTLPAPAVAIGVGLDREPRLAAARELWHYSRAGERVGVQMLGPAWDEPVTAVAVDALRSRVWVVGRDKVARVPTDDRPDVRVLDLYDDIRHGAFDARTGLLWLVTGTGVIAAHGDDASALEPAIEMAVRLEADDLRLVAVDPVRSLLYVAGKRGVRALDPARGDEGHPLSAADDVRVLAAPALRLTPQVALERPPPDATLTEPRPTIDLRVAADCNGAPCEVPSDYLDTFRIEASLAGRTVSDLFRRQAGSALFSAVVPDALLPGATAFTAFAVDRFGHRSPPLATTWARLDPVRLLPPPKAPNRAPSVALTTPIDGARFVPGAAIVLEATAADTDGSVARVEFYRDGATLVGTDATSPYAFTWPSVPAGTYRLTAKATDNKGASSTSAAATVVVAAPSNAPPAITIVTPADGTAVPVGAAVTLTAMASDADGTTERIDFLDGDTLLGSVPGHAPSLSASWNVDALGRGEHVLKAVAYDNAGASAFATATVRVTAAPLVVLTMPDACVRPDAPADLLLTADALAPDGAVTEVAFYAGSTPIGSARTEPYAVAWGAVAAGTYILTARATDDHGTTATSSSVTITVGATNSPPSVALTAPSEGATFAAGTSVTLAASATDADGTIAKVEFFDGGALLGTVTAPPYTLAWSAAPPGSRTLAARATDDLGASAMSAPVRITVANAAPSVSLASPGDGAIFTAPATINLTATASDPDGVIASVQYFSGSSLIGGATTPPYAVAWPAVPAGTYSLTARATDNLGAVTTSAAAVVSVSSNAAPAVALTSPGNGSSYVEPASVALAASASDTDGVVTRVDFYQGSTLIGSAGSPPFALSWASVPAGNYALTARATDNMGATTTSLPVNITVASNAPPQISLSSPSAGSRYFAPATVMLAATASDGDGVARVEFYQGSTLIGAVGTAPYELAWDDVAAGTYTLTAVATDAHGAAATSGPVSIVVAPGIALSAAQGLDGATIDDDVVLLRGSILAPANSGVSANGRLAQIDAQGNFYVNRLPLAPGPNTITITAVTQDGQTATQTLAMTSSGPSPFAVVASPVDGLAPLSVTLQIDNRGGASFETVEMDFDDDGIVDDVIPAAAFSDGRYELALTYPAGTWSTTVRVKDAAGNAVHTSTTIITALPPLQVESKLRGVLTNMLDRLRAGNVAAALSAVTDAVYEKYSGVFETLRPALGSIVPQIGTLEEVTFDNDQAEYSLVRATTEGPQRFMIYLLRGGDGIWRIEGM